MTPARSDNYTDVEKAYWRFQHLIGLKGGFTSGVKRYDRILSGEIPIGRVNRLTCIAEGRDPMDEFRARRNRMASLLTDVTAEMQEIRDEYPQLEADAEAAREAARKERDVRQETEKSNRWTKGVATKRLKSLAGDFERRVDRCESMLRATVESEGALVSADGRVSEEYAERLVGVDLSKCRDAGDGPAFFRVLGGAPTYRLHDLAAWIESHFIGGEQ